MRQVSKIIKISSGRTFATAIKYAEVGSANKVLRLEHYDAIQTVGPHEVAIKFIAAPINPSDLNMVEGVYGVKPKLPAVGGNEGVARVTKVGEKVSQLKEGDWVIPAGAGFGTWRDDAVTAESNVLRVSNDIPAAYAATLAVNPATAFRMLRDFEKLVPGDVIIQNGANSMVGLAVIQMAREMGVKTVNIIRSDRPEGEKTLRLLANLGGDINIPDTFLNTHEFQEIMKDLPPCKLALNCVGGELATEMVRALAPNGTLVTYGGMSKRPLVVPFDTLVNNQLNLKGFWISAWNDMHTPAERTTMLEEISGMIRANKLTHFYEMHDFDDFDFALKRATEQFTFRKVVLNMEVPDRFAEHDARPASDYEHFSAPVV